MLDLAALPRALTVQSRLALLRVDRQRRGLITVTDFLDAIGDRRDHGFDTSMGIHTIFVHRVAGIGPAPRMVYTYSPKGHPIRVFAYTPDDLGVLILGHRIACAYRAARVM